MKLSKQQMMDTHKIFNQYYNIGLDILNEINRNTDDKWGSIIRKLDNHQILGLSMVIRDFTGLKEYGSVPGKESKRLNDYNSKFNNLDHQDCKSLEKEIKSQIANGRRKEVQQLNKLYRNIIQSTVLQQQNMNYEQVSKIRLSNEQYLNVWNATTNLDLSSIDQDIASNLYKEHVDNGHAYLTNQCTINNLHNLVNTNEIYVFDLYVALVSDLEIKYEENQTQDIGVKIQRKQQEVFKESIEEYFIKGMVKDCAELEKSIKRFAHKSDKDLHRGIFIDCYKQIERRMQVRQQNIQQQYYQQQYYQR